MQALLRFGLLASMLCCCLAMIRHAARPDPARLARSGRWLRGLTLFNLAALLLWLIGLARH